MSRLLVTSAALAVVLGIAGAASADRETVLQVVAVQVKSGELDEYVERVAKFNGIRERLGVKATLRIWRATAAGPNTGTVVVGIEYPTMAAYAEGTTKLSADKEWRDLISGLDDIRTISSNSLYRELTP